jgi:hypothetical protein
MEELLREAVRIIKGSIAMQEAYTRRQQNETGVTMGVYLMPDERKFVRKAEKLLNNL